MTSTWAERPTTHRTDPSSSSLLSSTLSESTRSSPSPPPTPKLRPRVFSGSRQPKPRIIGHQSYLASASSNIDTYASESETETEAEAHGVRVFVQNGVIGTNRRPSFLNDPRASLLHTTAPSPNRERSPSIPSAPARKSPTHFSTRLNAARALRAVFTERVHVPIPFSSLELVFDVRRAGEALILLSTLYLASWRLYQHSFSDDSLRPVVLELLCLTILALVHPLLGAIQNTTRLSDVPKVGDGRRPLSPPGSGPRENEMSFVWMTDMRDYRDCLDDGGVTSFVFVPIVVATLLNVSLEQAAKSFDANPIPGYWLISPPFRLHTSPSFPTPIQSLVESRKNLIQLANLCSFILFCHLSASRWMRWRQSTLSNGATDDWRPKGEGRRAWLYAQFSLALTAAAMAIRLTFQLLRIDFWKDLSYFEVFTICNTYQFLIYGMVKLGRRAFTLGELGLVAQGATALFMESVQLTGSRIWPVTTEFIKTYRAPTPLLIFQVALIPGAFLTGFLLSPILVLSRNLAQKPSYRLRFPDQKIMFRRVLALGFYVLAVLVVACLIGPWTGWCLDPVMNRGTKLVKILGNPWIWLGNFLVGGRRTWVRPAILAYWGILAVISLAGWGRQLARARKSGKRVVNIPPGTGAFPSTVAGVGMSTALMNGSGYSTQRTHVRGPSKEENSLQSPLSASFSASQAAMSQSMTEFFDAADKRVGTLSLNARRKFFHALTVVMFIPGMALDSAFSHLAFSVAFSLFIFVEYVRYFALYPFSAVVHIFMNEFIDEKDGGTAILSHFYLLTGCAAGVWLEGPSKLLEMNGVLVLGIGDAMASIVGKRIGKHQWTANSPKTIEGSAAFAASVFISVWILRILGVIESFSSWRYMIAVTISSILEALSLQNDNLTLPLYMWALLILMRA